MAMESPFQRKPSGFSNSVSQTMGFPSSGEMQQGARSLPPQRQQSPFQHKDLGREEPFSGGPMPRPVTQGQTAQGAQFQMHPTRLSPGLSSYMRSWEGQQANAFNQMGIDSRMSAMEQMQQQMQKEAAQQAPRTFDVGQPAYAAPQQGAPPPEPPDTTEYGPTESSAPDRPEYGATQSSAPDRPEQPSWGDRPEGGYGQPSPAVEDPTEKFHQSLPENMDPALKKLISEGYQKSKELEAMFDEGGVYDAKATAALKAHMSKQQQAIEMKYAEAGLGTSASSSQMAQHDLDAMKAIVQQKSDLAILQLKAKESTAGQLARLYGQLNNTQMQQKSLELQEKSQKSSAILRVLGEAYKWGTKVDSAEFNALLSKALVEAGIDPTDSLVEQMHSEYKKKIAGGGKEEEEAPLGTSDEFKQKIAGLKYHAGGFWTDDTALLETLGSISKEEREWMKENMHDFLAQIWSLVNNEPTDEDKWFELMGYGYTPDDKNHPKPASQVAHDVRPSQ